MTILANPWRACLERARVRERALDRLQDLIIEQIVEELTEELTPEGTRAEFYRVRGMTPSPPSGWQPVARKDGTVGWRAPGQRRGRLHDKPDVPIEWSEELEEQEQQRRVDEARLPEAKRRAGVISGRMRQEKRAEILAREHAHVAQGGRRYGSRKAIASETGRSARQVSRVLKKMRTRTAE